MTLLCSQKKKHVSVDIWQIIKISTSGYIIREEYNILTYDNV